MKSLILWENHLCQLSSNKYHHAYAFYRDRCLAKFHGMLNIVTASQSSDTGFRSALEPFIRHSLAMIHDFIARIGSRCWIIKQNMSCRCVDSFWWHWKLYPRHSIGSTRRILLQTQWVALSIAIVRHAVNAIKQQLAWLNYISNYALKFRIAWLYHGNIWRVIARTNRIS